MTKWAGYRSVAVDGGKFRWKFLPGAKSSRLTVVPEDSSHGHLEVRMPEWRDPWLAPGADAVNQPQQVTSRFAAEAIRCARLHGLAQVARGRGLHLEFVGGEFLLRATPSRAAP